MNNYFTQHVAEYHTHFPKNLHVMYIRDVSNALETMQLAGNNSFQKHIEVKKSVNKKHDKACFWVCKKCSVM